MSLTGISNERSMLSMIVLVALALATVIFVLKKASDAISENGRLNEQPAYLGTKTAIRNESPSTFEGWKEYHDKVFGYTMKYPPELRPSFDKTSGFVSGRPSAHLFLEPIADPDDRLVGNNTPTLGFYIAVFPKSQKEREVAAIGSRVKNAYNVYEFRADLIQQIKQPVIMYKLTSTLGTHYIAYFEGGNYFFEVAASGDYDIRQVQDLISTFSFD